MKCHNLELVFIDICKNAGTAVIQGFRHSFPNYEFEGKHHSIKNFTSDITCTPVSEYEVNNYFLFSVIRNPFDRMVSLWHWGLRSEYNISFYKFIHNVRDGVYTEYNRHRYRTQLDWISDNNDIIKVSNLVSYENLQHDFNHKVCEKLNINHINLPLVNSAYDRSGLNKSHYRDYYNHETRNIVEKLYEQDLSYFNYSF